MSIEPVVASHSSLKAAIAEQYRKLERSSLTTVEVGGASLPQDGGLPVNFDFHEIAIQRKEDPLAVKPYGKDPFFDGPPGSQALPEEPAMDPFGLFGAPSLLTPGQGIVPDPIDARPAGTVREDTLPAVVHEPAKIVPPKMRLSAFRTRTIVFGLIKLMEQKGLVGEDELASYINMLLDSGVLKDDGRTGSIRIMPE
jgi:hypothetical protein